MADNEKRIPILIQTKELKFAIMNKTHVTARSLQASGKLTYEATSNAQQTEFKEEGYELNRAISDAIAEAKLALSEYLVDETDKTDNLVRKAIYNGDALTLTFQFPSNYNNAAVDELGSAIHDFIVGRSIYDWYRQTYPEIAEACRIDAMAALGRAKEAQYKRRRPERPKYTP